jgi:hypothetical protein
MCRVDLLVPLFWQSDLLLSCLVCLELLDETHYVVLDISDLIFLSYLNIGVIS